MFFYVEVTCEEVFVERQRHCHEERQTNERVELYQHTVA